MPSIKSVACATFALLSVASAHFQLTTPPTIGFDDDKEPNGPCGGFTPSFSDKNAFTDFHVGGQPIGMNLFHAQATWLFRATFDETASGNWTKLGDIVQQSGIGKFCEKAITAPESWVGKQGVLSIVADAPDGLLYQCAIVNFVSGTSTNFTDCVNGTATAAVVSDPLLEALVGNSSTATPTPTNSGTGTSNTATAKPSPTNAAPGVGPALGSIGFTVVLSALGLALL